MLWLIYILFVLCPSLMQFIAIGSAKKLKYWIRASLTYPTFHLKLFYNWLNTHTCLRLARISSTSVLFIFDFILSFSFLVWQIIMLLLTIHLRVSSQFWLALQVKKKQSDLMIFQHFSFNIKIYFQIIRSILLRTFEVQKKKHLCIDTPFWNLIYILSKISQVMNSMKMYLNVNSSANNCLPVCLSVTLLYN